MWFISLGWQDAIKVIGVLGMCSGTVALAGWLAINNLLKLKFP